MSSRKARRRIPGVLVRANNGDLSPAAFKPPGWAVESDRLPSDVRRRVVDAVDLFGGRVTIGDVASNAGLELDEAQWALQALATDTNGFLEVSDEGDILYVFRKDYRLKLAAKSIKMKLEPLFEMAKSASGFLIRFFIGTALIASMALAFSIISVLVEAATAALFKAFSKSDDDLGRKQGCSCGLSFTFSSSTDNNILRESDERRWKATHDEGMIFFESAFSFFFGDGDPNQGIEEERWKLIGEYLSSTGGMVTAEELAPYLDVKTTEDLTNGESYIFPVLLWFGGQPEVDEEGNILYRFPSLQHTASQRSGRKKYQWVGGVENIFKENKWQFSKTSIWRRAMVVGLGVLNLFVAGILLGFVLEDTPARPTGLVIFVSLIQIYAGSFIIPVLRYYFILSKNVKIGIRNRAREQCAEALESPDISLRHKLRSAREMSYKSFIRQDQSQISTEKGLLELDYD